MKKRSRTAIIAGGISFILAVLLMVSLSGMSNGFFEFCTTKAYGWPAPWKIEYCLCEGGKTVYPIKHFLLNLGVASGCGVVVFGVARKLQK